MHSSKSNNGIPCIFMTIYQNILLSHSCSCPSADVFPHNSKHWMLLYNNLYHEDCKFLWLVKAITECNKDIEVMIELNLPDSLRVRSQTCFFSLSLDLFFNLEQNKIYVIFQYNRWTVHLLQVCCSTQEFGGQHWNFHYYLTTLYTQAFPFKMKKYNIGENATNVQDVSGAMPSLQEFPWLGSKVSFCQALYLYFVDKTGSFYYGKQTLHLLYIDEYPEDQQSSLNSAEELLWFIPQRFVSCNLGAPGGSAGLI